jgi:hypothetical protein
VIVRLEKGGLSATARADGKFTITGNITSINGQINHSPPQKLWPRKRIGEQLQTLG